jgi:hypothetical protein
MARCRACCPGWHLPRKGVGACPAMGLGIMELDLALQWGWMSPNEVRALEDLNPREEGDDFYDPPNTAGGDPPAEPAADPDAPAAGAHQHRHPRATGPAGTTVTPATAGTAPRLSCRQPSSGFLAAGCCAVAKRGSPRRAQGSRCGCLPTALGACIHTKRCGKPRECLRQHHLQSITQRPPQESAPAAGAAQRGRGLAGPFLQAKLSGAATEAAADAPTIAVINARVVLLPASGPWAPARASLAAVVREGSRPPRTYLAVFRKYSTLQHPSPLTSMAAPFGLSCPGQPPFARCVQKG